MADSLKVLERGTLIYSLSTSSTVFGLQYKKYVLGSKLCVIIQFTSLCSCFSCYVIGCSAFHCLNNLYYDDPSFCMGLCS